MSNAPSPGWPPPAVPRPSASWQVLQSWWLLLPVLGCSCLGGFGFIYVGARARRAAWWIPGIVYAVVGWTAFMLVGESDKESAVSDWAVGVLLAVWASSILHAALINPAWLRWLTHRRARTAAAWPAAAYPLAPLPRAAPAGPAPAPYPGMTLTYPPSSPAGYPSPYPSAAYPPPSAAYPPPSAGYPQAGSPYPPQPFGPAAQPPGSPVGQPPAPVGYPPPAADPTMVPYQPVDSFGPEPLAPPSDPWADGESGRVDVNTVGPEALAALPGFDPQRARQVVAERDRRGSFGSLAEFAAAANLAPHEYARLRDALYCVPPAGPAPGQSPPGRVLDV